MTSQVETIAISILEKLAGYAQSDEYATLSIFQDDATMDWYVNVGDNCFWGSTLSEALTKAQ